jgi:multiple antibiotic resistance protein
MSLASSALVAFGSLFSIVDPLTAVPPFLALVGSHSNRTQSETALRASATCFAVLVAFGLAGNLIFTFFGITLSAFKIAGGILLFGVALDLMRAKRVETRATKAEADEAETKDDVAVIPLGVPLLAGPGAVATVMVLVGKAQSFPERATVFAAITAVGVSSLLVLRSAPMIARALGTTGINIVGRVMGLILASVATQFVIDGANGAFPRLFAGAP